MKWNELQRRYLEIKFTKFSLLALQGQTEKVRCVGAFIASWPKDTEKEMDVPFSAFVEYLALCGKMSFISPEAMLSEHPIVNLIFDWRYDVATNEPLVRSGLRYLVKEKIQSAQKCQQELYYFTDSARRYNYTELMIILSALSLSVRSIALSNACLSDHSPENIVAIFRSIPSHVIHLNIAQNYLFLFSIEGQLKTILAGIPDHFELLGIGGNFLYCFGIQLGELLSVLPPTVKKLDISGNKLANIHVPDLINLISTIPSHITALNMGYNNFSLFNDVNVLRDIYSAIPEHITSLSSEEGKIFAALDCLHPGIAALDISDNNLGFQEIDGLTEKIRWLPKFTSHLDLSDNMLNYLGLKNFCKLLSVIPQQVTSLRLCNNKLNVLVKDSKRAQDLLTDALLKLVPRMNQLDLSGNNLPQSLTGRIQEEKEKVSSLKRACLYTLFKSPALMAKALEKFDDFPDIKEMIEQYKPIYP